MFRYARKGSKKVGLAPGTLVHIGEAKAEDVKFTVIEYSDTRFLQEQFTKEEVFSYATDPNSITWINLDGIHQLDLIEKIGKRHGLHPLTLEDIVNTGQRPKLEDYDDYLFIVLKMIYFSEEDNQLKAEQVSLILKPGLVISFQEKEGDVFSPVRERIRNGKGKIRREGSDYLAYAIIDAIVDHYFVILETLGERIEAAQEELIADPSSATLEEIHELKHEMIFLRRSIWPLREVINNMERDESSLIQQSTLLYLRDVYDHIAQVIDTIETFREMLSGMLDVYLSSISNKMNEVMKVLTIIATVFIPLTFLAGIYGMNFKYMPELEWPWGYPLLLIVMAAAGAAMIYYFRQKKWL